MKFVKKPVVVEAVQWFERHICTPQGVVFYNPDDEFYVVTIHGQKAKLSDGDWIITEPDGIHHYPCKPDIFEATYEAVPESAGS